MSTKQQPKQKTKSSETEAKNNKKQQVKRPPLPEPNLFKDGVGMYDFHGDKDEKPSE